MRSLLAGSAAALALAAPTVAAPPQAGVVVPGRALGGLRLGLTAAQVYEAWGRNFGVCRGCRERTWYYNYRRFAPQGAGVAFRGGRVAAIFTLWSPPGWHTDRGLRVGDPAARATELYGALARSECGSYSALLLPGRSATTSVYLVNERVWGFGLSRPAEPVCR